jgi:hypothetical protein
MPQSQDNSRWVDFDTLVAESVAGLRSRGWDRADAPGRLERLVERCADGACASWVTVAKMIGGQLDFQDKSLWRESGLTVRYRLRLRDGEPIFFEGPLDFLDWMRANRPTLKTWVEREKLGAAALEPRASPERRARRAL